MPKGLQLIANLLPSTPYFKVFNSLASEGAKLKNINNGFVHLLVLLLIGYLLLYLRFKFAKQKIKTVAKKTYN
jgi:ABC-2 type transport system permease protein